MTEELLSQLPDRNHIEQICKALWSGQQFGRASVMIGAGFSRNAKKLSSSFPDFPLWGDLAKKIQEHLYPEQNGKGNPDPLKLASQFEIVFGRTALNELLVQAIPDQQYNPSELHEKLLKLPWSDIFTTNYDTLLERATDKVPGRKYDIVYQYSDIPQCMQPRIVKLHGSFPSHYPLIITEEDYRTYPQRFSPFVNLVQQSMMENVFCLLGFSGEDPNFSNWLGWVRDNLGEATQPVYLCGCLNLSNSWRKLLESRNIIPVDLSPIVPREDFINTNQRHAEALNWFLDFLENRKPQDSRKWPYQSTPILEAFYKKQLEEEELKQLNRDWQKERLDYPGWMICPRENRNVIWHDTKQLMHEIFYNSIDKLEFPFNLSLVYELYWRLSITLTPLFNQEWGDKIESILNCCNPSPKHISNSEAEITPKKYPREYNGNELDWFQISQCWVELQFFLMREDREDHLEEKFNKRVKILENIVKQNSEWQARWFYEQCLFSLLQLKFDSINDLLDQWNKSKKQDLPNWEIKRAALMAEVGRSDEAYTIAEEALNRIRFCMPNNSTDYTLLSQEGSAIFLLYSIKSISSGLYVREDNILEEYRDRLNDLEIYKCNTDSEVKKLSLPLDKERPKPPKHKETKPAFDPRRTTTTYSYSSVNIYEYRPAFEFLRFFEEAGMINRYSKLYLTPIEWIFPITPLLSLTTLVRIADNQKETTDFITRIRLAVLEKEDIDYLEKILSNSVDEIVKILENFSYQNNNFTGHFWRKLSILLEFLSRLCQRFSAEQLEKLLDLTITLYKIEQFREYDRLPAKKIGLLFDRIFYAIDQEELLRYIPKLLILPFTSDAQGCLEPFVYLEWKNNFSLPNNFDRSHWSEQIQNLIEQVNSQNTQVRQDATLRLGKLYEIQGLTQQESEDFADALWSRSNSDQELPNGFTENFRKVYFLCLPEQQLGQAKTILRHLLLSQEIPRIHDSRGGLSSLRIDQNFYFFDELLNTTSPLLNPSQNNIEQYIDWRYEEVIQLLDKISNWWREEKVFIIQKLQNAVQPRFLISNLEQKIRTNLLLIVKILTRVILPKLGESKEVENNEQVKQLLSEFENEAKIPIYSALPMTLLLDSSAEAEKIAQKFRQGINSLHREDTQEAIEGLFRWLFYGNAGSIAMPPNDLIEELINKVAYRRQPAVDIAISHVSLIVERLPEILNHQQLTTLCTGLEYLIKDTSLPDNLWKLESRNNSNRIISIDKLPEYREYCTKLAYQLYVYYQEQGEAIPEVLNQWKEISAQDPLPEVKRAWPESN